MIQERKNPIVADDLKWIFACSCEGTEQEEVWYEREMANGS